MHLSGWWWSGNDWEMKTWSFFNLNIYISWTISNTGNVCIFMLRLDGSGLNGERCHREWNMFFSCQRLMINVRTYSNLFHNQPSSCLLAEMFVIEIILIHPPLHVTQTKLICFKKKERKRNGPMYYVNMKEFFTGAFTVFWITHCIMLCFKIKGNSH